MAEKRGPRDRIAAAAGGDGVVETLSSGLPGADLTSLLLEVMRRRAGAVAAPDLLRRHESDRFVRPSGIDYRLIRRAEDVLLGAVPDDFDLVQLAPAVPLGTHAVLGPMNQNRVVSTVRASELAADPTNGLALEAAVRRRADRSGEPVRLAALQRVTRAQPLHGPQAYAHFTLLGFVTAGRDPGGQAFAKAAAVEHTGLIADGLLAAGAERVRVELTDYTGRRYVRVVETVIETLAGLSRVDVVVRPDRADGRGYYDGLRFGFYAVSGKGLVDCADGGLVDWTGQLLGDAKERLMISGIGVDRVALLKA